jgi:hypothetical protein
MMLRRLVPIVTIFSMGVAAVVAGVYLIDARSGRPFWGTFLEVVGAAFLAVALTAPISEYFQFLTLSRHMRLVQAAQGAGISSIYRSRVEDRDSFHAALDRAFNNAHELSLGGIALPGIFHDPPYPTGIEKALCDPKVRLRILFLDPYSADTDERADIEKGRGVRSDIRSSLDQLRNILAERASKLKRDPEELLNADKLDMLNIRLHLYRFPPQALVILTESVLFLEQYHFGRPPHARVGECVGGRTPMIEFDSGSNTFSIMRAHFDYVWEHKSTDETESLIRRTKGGPGPA